MLDLNKLAPGLHGFGQHLAQESAANRQRLERAWDYFGRATLAQSELLRQQALWQDRLGFGAPIPLEPLDLRVDLLRAPLTHTVLATDGSQIAPTHHEIAYCYLINTGRVALYYGQQRYPRLDSLPELFYKPQDLYASRQWGIRTEEWMGYQRTVSEAKALGEMAKEHSTSGCPTLAIVDGPLIHWFLEALHPQAQAQILPPILEAWEELRQARIPLVGYISASRSREVFDFLRLESCPYPEPDCGTHCPRAGSGASLPCQIFEPLRDPDLWQLLLSPGQRGPLWRSQAPIMASYGPHEVYFCYALLGQEVGRLEMPAWVVEDEELLTTTLSLTWAQVEKGCGYPVALAEAHNQAVVRGADRSSFFALLEQQMIKAGLRRVGVSYKEARKRGSIA